MKDASLFHRLREPAAPIRFTFEGEEIVAAPGDSLAAALLVAGVSVFRVAPVGGAPRGPFCMMGSCFECLVEVDGEPSVQACMTEARDGMRVRRQTGGAVLADD